MRKTDWKEQLIAYLEDCARLPFAYGRHDCALFAAGAVRAMTGIDLAADWRGRYRTLNGGFKVLRRAGYADHIALTAAVLPEVHLAFAAPGDLAVIDTPQGRALGVVQGEGVYVLGAAGGMGLVPIGDATLAFRVA